MVVTYNTVMLQFALLHVLLYYVLSPTSETQHKVPWLFVLQNKALCSLFLLVAYLFCTGDCSLQVCKNKTILSAM